MTTAAYELDDLISQDYQHGFFTDVETDAVPRGLNEDVIHVISAKKNEPPFMLAWRLKAYRHWLTMTEPHWATVKHPAIDYQDIVYYSNGTTLRRIRRAVLAVCAGVGAGRSEAP